jgi:hypothetical protein
MENKYIKSFREAVEKLEEYNRKNYEWDPKTGNYTFSKGNEFFDIVNALGNLQKAVDKTLQKSKDEQVLNVANRISNQLKEMCKWFKDPNLLSSGRRIDLF